MAAVEHRSLSRIADETRADDLHAEYEQITERIERDPVITTLHSYAVLAAIAIARVKVLEADHG